RLTLSSYIGELARSSDPEVRRRAGDAIRTGLGPYLQVLATALGGSIQRDAEVARLRGYKRPADLHLARQGLGAADTDAVVEGMFELVGPQVRRLAALRKRVLGLDAFHLH